MEINNGKNLMKKCMDDNNGQNIPCKDTKNDNLQNMANKSTEANNSQKVPPKSTVSSNRQKVTKNCTEANNGQNSEDHTDKNATAEAGESPGCCKSSYPRESSCVPFAECLDTGCLPSPGRGIEFQNQVELKSLPLHPQLSGSRDVKLPVIVTGRKQVYWKCGKAGHPWESDSGRPRPPL